MENVLNAFASGLKIQYQTEEKMEFKPASEEQITAFKEAMKKHLASRGKIREYGDIITYDYYRAKIRGGMRGFDERHVESANANLAEVLLKLPKLPEGECYVFPTPTFVSFQIVGKMGNDSDFNPVKACPWILGKL